MAHILYLNTKSVRVQDTQRKYSGSDQVNTHLKFSVCFFKQDVQ